MMRHEKAELALRIAAIPFFVWGVCTLFASGLPFAIGFVGASPGPWGGILDAFWAGMVILATSAVPIAVGFCLLRFSLGLAGRLLRSEAAASEPQEVTPLHIGTFLLGLYWFTQAAPAVATVGVTWVLDEAELGMMGAVGLAWSLLPLYFLWSPHHLRAFLSALCRTGQGTAGGFLRLLAVGLTLIALNFCFWALLSFSGSVVSFVDRALRGLQEAEQLLRQSVEGYALTLVLIIGLLLCAGRSAGWLASFAKLSRDDNPPTTLPDRQGIFRLALLTGGIALLCHSVGHAAVSIAGPLLRAQGVQARVLIPALIFVFAAVLLLALCVLRGSKLAAKLYPECGDSEERGPEAFRLILEIAVAVVGLYYACRLLPRCGRIPVADGLALAFPLLMVAFRGDIAWWLSPGRQAAAPADIGPRRRAHALVPWLMLLGAYVFLGNVAGAAFWMIGMLTGADVTHWALLRPAVGWMLTFGAPRLSRLLSYGRLMPKMAAMDKHRWQPSDDSDETRAGEP
ncbi:MAG: hypothetical protein QGH74_05315 [Candidatus Brocadiia bacterium]|nr:hypothetical protein [Candidatus Brocadiia bacterium]